ncbi:AgmX/PglI C-terminal domain-containing protein [bacterium]|nr:AgmX/PglI C-terminal domain-containing protein [bacterium]
MSVVTTLRAESYRLPWHVILIGEMDARTRRSFAIAGALGVLLLATVALTPAPVLVEPTLEAMPERLAKLILERPAEPKAVAPKSQVQAPPEFAEAPPAPAAVETPQAAPVTPPRPERRVIRKETAPRVAPDQGQAGRKEAQAATASLAKTSVALDKTLAELSAALPTADDNAAPRTERNRGRLRRGRGREQLAGVSDAVAPAAADAGGPVLLAAGLSVDLGEMAVASSGGGAGGAVGGAGDGGAEIRSNASLLAVLQRYAPGIRYCYDNALKRQGDLAGKLVLRLTVEGDGSVSDATVVDDTLHSAEVLDCVLAQVNAWRFGAVEGGRVSFNAPFVFSASQ